MQGRITGRGGLRLRWRSQRFRVLAAAFALYAALGGAFLYYAERVFSCEEALSSSALPPDLHTAPATKAQAAAFVSRYVARPEARKSLHDNIRASHAVVFGRRPDAPLLRCDGYYGQGRDGTLLFYAFRLNGAVYYVVRDEKGVWGDQESLPPLTLL
jgi:hypothetical protein